MPVYGNFPLAWRQAAGSIDHGRHGDEGFVAWTRHNEAGSIQPNLEAIPAAVGRLRREPRHVCQRPHLGGL